MSQSETPAGEAEPKNEPESEPWFEAKMHIFSVLIVTLQQEVSPRPEESEFFKPIYSSPDHSSPRREQMRQNLWFVQENNKRSMKYLFCRDYLDTLSITEKVLGNKRILASREDFPWPHIPVILGNIPMGDCQDKKNFSHRTNQSSKLP